MSSCSESTTVVSPEAARASMLAELIPLIIAEGVDRATMRQTVSAIGWASAFAGTEHDAFFAEAQAVFALLAYVAPARELRVLEGGGRQASHRRPIRARLIVIKGGRS